MFFSRFSDAAEILGTKNSGKLQGEVEPARIVIVIGTGNSFCPVESSVNSVPSLFISTRVKHICCLDQLDSLGPLVSTDSFRTTETLSHTT